MLKRVVFVDMESNHDEDSNLQKPALDHDEETKSQRGPTIKPKANKGKTIITYNKRGVPFGDGAKRLATFEGMTARTMVPITFDSWLDVPKETKKYLWQYVLDKSKKSKNVRANNKYNHRLSRKGYAGLTADMMQETGKTEEEIDRATLWKKARELKTRGFDSNVQEIVDKIYLDTEKKKLDERFNKLEEEVEKLKRGVTNVFEAASCQMWGYEDDLEDKPHEESLDNSCYLAVDVASNIVAKGAIMKYSDSGENIEVMMEICVQGEAFLPIPLEEELIMKVKDAVGHILSWPRHLVIRCSDLEKVVAKPKSKKRQRELDEENGKEKKKQPVEPDEVVEKENAKENRKENAKKDDEIVENKKESGKEKENEKKDDERVENKTEKKRKGE
ncbi:hypothetical protein L1987_03548 [Smallanthus sonchifolius]|uniref:Uncharacterized protein n=1 Tax=Smallanthus sonchifolius TaxID=185202 RepID=A0ACB9KAY2_9ASTR|nr:hypothetical protein L1987_03548 [Smallanthus sonchifolius]